MKNFDAIVDNYDVATKAYADAATTVEDVLSSTSAVNALSANQGKVLNDSKQRKPAYKVIESGAIDLAEADVFFRIVDEDVAFTVANAPTCAMFVLILQNGGSHNVTFPYGTIWSNGVKPELSESGTDVLTFMTTDGGVTSWVGFKSALNVKSAV